MVIVFVWLTKKFEKDRTFYTGSAVAALMVEVVLQAFTAVYMAMTVSHARANQLYLFGHVEYPPCGHDALFMYSGALLWIVSVGIAFICGILMFTPLGRIPKGALSAA